MRRILCLLCLYINDPAHAMELHLEYGETVSFMARPQFYTKSEYTAFALRTSGTWYAELLQGGWEGGERYGRFLALSGGARSSGRYFAEASAGVAYMANYHTDQLDGNAQFILSAGIGRRFDDGAFVTLRLRHISNGSALAGDSDRSKDKNNSVDFGLLSFGVTF